MTTADLTQHVSIRSILFGSDQAAIDALVNALTSERATSAIRDGLVSLSEVTRAAAANELSKVASGLLNVGLTDVLIMAWRKHSTLAAAARRTADNANTEELVDLATHRISWLYQPYVELFVDNLKVATINFQINLNFEVKGLVVAIRAGRLTAVHAGSCIVTAALAAEGLKIAERTAQFELPFVIHLGDGVPLHTVR
jgi:hypothetical protein